MLNTDIPIPALLPVFAGVFLLVWFALTRLLENWPLWYSRFSENTEVQLSKLFVFRNAHVLLLLFFVLLIVVPLVTYWFSGLLILALASVVALVLIPRLLFKQMWKSRMKTTEQDLPDFLDQVAGTMLSGSTFVASVQSYVEESSGPIEQEFSLFLREIRLGTHLDEALDNLAERIRSDDMDLVVSAVLIARDVGGNLAETFKRLATTLRQKNQMERKIAALTSQGILQGWVVSLLPFAILLALHFIEPDSVKAIWSSLLGWLFLGIIIVLELIGSFFIRRIVRIDI